MKQIIVEVTSNMTKILWLVPHIILAWEILGQGNIGVAHERLLPLNHSCIKQQQIL